jgi:thiol-disulfide isomerase/thioredoxin
MIRILKIAFLLCMVAVVGCEYQTPTDASNSTADQWRTSGRHVVAFTLKSCGQCRRDKPQLTQLQSQGVDVVSVDGDERPDLVREYQVTEYPTYLAVDDGQIKSRSVSIAIIVATLKAIYWIASVFI